MYKKSIKEILKTFFDLMIAVVMLLYAAFGIETLVNKIKRIKT